jgi:hypothetical protein
VNLLETGDSSILKGVVLRLDTGGYLSALYALDVNSKSHLIVLSRDTFCHTIMAKFEMDMVLSKISHNNATTQKLPKRLSFRNGYLIGVIFRKEHEKEFPPKYYK